MSVMFEGGPLAGQSMPDPAAPPAEAAPEESEGVLFSRLLADCRSLLQLSTLQEKNKLLLSKAESLLQTIAANEEKDDEAAMGGKLTPGVLRKLGGGGAGY